MIITIISKDNLRSITLPSKRKGQYWLSDASNNRLASIEGVRDEWIMKPTRGVHILGLPTENAKSVPLVARHFYVLEKAGGKKTSIFTEPVTDDRQLFTKYHVTNSTRLTIGRDPSNDICYPVDVISSHHASIAFQNNRWYLRDEDSRNGTFVNECRVLQQELYPGSSIFIMGLKIVLGSDFIAINNPDGCVRICPRLLRFSVQTQQDYPEDSEYELPTQSYFYRSPRFKREVSTATFRIDPPPTSPLTEELPLLLSMGPALAMGAMAMVTLITAFASYNIMSMAMGFSMLLGTVLIPGITKRYEHKKKSQKEKLRQEKYHLYLQEMSAKIQKEARLQEEILNENGVSVQECERRILDRQRNLWERSPGQNDFLQVRVGNGNGVLDAKIHYTERKFSLIEDNLLEEQYALGESEKPLHNIPITYSLFEHPVSGVIGPPDAVAQFAKGLILQLAALYSYDEVKFIFLYDSADSQFKFTKWLPHVWSDDRKFRFLATTPEEVKEVSAYFEKILEVREAATKEDQDRIFPYYIIFSLSKTLALRAELLKKVLISKANLHISIVAFYQELQDLPKECSIVTELDGINGHLFHQNDITGQSIHFTADIAPTQDPLPLSILLANTVLNHTENKFQLPSTLPFLEMYGVGKVEHLNALERWKEHDPTQSLVAPVGTDVYGGTFLLDLHEKFHGPHGLVAGMTGSGKSEFIITYILSLAVNYHPHEVAFILIDYKGGGTAKSFENLPHTAGIITNLDGSAIKRSLVSIQSELKRRQAMFTQAGKQVGISNIDIYKYQKLYREGIVQEPLQHLFIIADEFAELKTQQPEFMTQLVSAARIGRSLGIHLILATQKPSGVVDDQIWSNSKFRVCLKVQGRADSIDMLKRPDAVELTDTGRFYLQVGYNELFEMGQSAWSGAPYYPSDTIQMERDNSIVVIDNNGHPIRQVRPDRKRPVAGRPQKQLDVVVEYLHNIAAEENIHVRKLWLDPIPAVILLDTLYKKYKVSATPFFLEPVVGEYDDPAQQRQDVFRLPLSQEGNVVVYGSAGSGKTSFLNAMLCSLLQDHTPDQLNLYLLDFSSETLRTFAAAPQVGGVVLSYEKEKLDALICMLQTELQTRRRLFAAYGGDYESYIQSAPQTLPSITVVVNNFSAMIELYPDHEESIYFLSREGVKYGIYFVLTAMNAGAVRFKLLQNFKQQIALQLNDSSDYPSIVGKTDGLLPTSCKGRGLVRQGGALYEFQTASLTQDRAPSDYIHQLCQHLENDWNGNHAPLIPVLPDYVDADFLKDFIDIHQPLCIPIGMNPHSMQVYRYSFGSAIISLALSEGDVFHPFTVDLSALLAEVPNLDTVVLDAPGTIPDISGSICICRTAEQCEQQVSKLHQLLLCRSQAYTDSNVHDKQPSDSKPVLVLIHSLAALQEMLPSPDWEKLLNLLQNSTASCGIHFLITDQADNLTAFCYDRWFLSNVSHGDGIWIGKGITKQFVLETGQTTSSMREDISSQFGYALHGEKCTRLKLLCSRKEETNDG